MMFRKSLTLLAVLGLFVASQPPASAQIAAPAAVVAQATLTCLSDADARIAVAQNSNVGLPQLLQRIPVTVNQLVGQPRLCRYSGRFVWEIWANTGGGSTRRVIDALTGVPVPGL